MKRYLPYAAAFLVLVLAAAWWFSPGQVIKRRTLSLLDTLTMEPGEARSGRALGSYSLNALLAPEVELDTPTIGEANGTFDRSELESAYSWLSSNARETRFKHERFESVTTEGDEGTVVFTLDALVELADRRPVDGHFEVTFRWRRDDLGKWRLHSASWDQTGERR
ncbi:MAG TPA: hypothetical protein VLO11_07135 [Luteolibacter sp.]|nr:hypothetical protein [Luteolibacter sp.]